MGWEDGAVVGTAMATVVVGGMDVMISAPSSLKLLLLPLPPILPALPARVAEGGEVRRRKMALMVITLASSHPHALQEVNGNGSFVVVVEKN
jgi:hypothetical protein